MPESASIPVYRSAAEAELGRRPDPAPQQPSDAVRRCCAAYQRALDAGKGTNSNYPKWAYLDAMPHFSDRSSIRDFIACVARAILLGIFSEAYSKSLLDAASLALQAIPRPVRPVGRPPKSSKNPLPEN